MFCIDLMMADLGPKHVALMWTDIAYFITVLIYSCVLDDNNYLFTTRQRDGIY